MPREQAHEVIRGRIASIRNARRAGAAACARRAGSCAMLLARASAGRIALHLLAMSGDRCVRFHVAGIVRELPWIAGTSAFMRQSRDRLLAALVGYLVRPLEQVVNAESQALAPVLARGDVLLSDSNTRISALVRRITRSPWSHVSMYVGPLDDGPDPRCVVEAHIGIGVRTIRLSELDAVQVRVLRPIGLEERERHQLATWAISQIGCEYDLAHAWELGRRLLLFPRRNLRSAPAKVASGASRFICCSLLAHAFALVGHPVVPEPSRNGLDPRVGQRHLTPGDFARAPVFELIAALESRMPAATMVSIDTIVQ
jgi:Permuted papain-like amidase enzyme, YaeF/YiiX, C92 family